MIVVEFLKALLYGIVEGITEWLPVSSTGHLILLGEWLPFRFSEDATLLAEFSEMFDVVIQLGAILAVVVLFRRKLWPFYRGVAESARKETWTLWFKIAVAALPAAVVGVLGDKLLEEVTGKSIDGWLYNAQVVAVALIVYGVAFLLIERLKRPDGLRTETTAAITFRQAFLIGLFQVLALVPGTSRSGSTILGAMLLGLSRPAAAEFTFVLAIPVMVGAGGIKALGFLSYVAESGVAVPAVAWGALAIAFVASFAVSLMAIRFLMDFVKRHSFIPFGIYRILLGVFVLLYFLVIR